MPLAPHDNKREGEGEMVKGGKQYNIGGPRSTAPAAWRPPAWWSEVMGDGAHIQP
jgi:hypothetical protein